MKSISLTTFAAFAVLSLTGCISSPPPDVYETDIVTGDFLSSEIKTDFPMLWWSQFQDDEMSGLIDRALASNKSLEVSAANVRVAEAIVGRQQLERGYTTRTTVGADFGRSARDGQDMALSVSGGIGASWEIDVFDRIRMQIAAAEFDVEAAREARQDIAVIIASNTALNYVQLRGAQRRLEVARQNAETQAQGLRLLRTLLENGRATRLDVERAEALYRTTLASQPRFEAAANNALSALAALTGQPANAPDAELLGLLEKVIDIPEHSGAIATGSVEGMIRRRPDVRRAEVLIGRELALSEAARADLFPSVVMNFCSPSATLRQIG